MIKFDKNVLKSLSIYVFFAVVSVVSVLPFISHGAIIGQGDLLFHLNRIVGLSEGIKDGFIPYRMFNVLSDTGSAVNFFYPFVYVIGFSVMFLLFKNDVSGFYFGEAILLFVTLVVAYRVMMAFANNSKQRSFLFAILYGFAAYRTYLAFDQYVLGEAFAYVFLPVAMLGFYNVFLGDNRKWPTLAIGITLVLYAHMLTSILLIALFVFLAILLFVTKQLTVTWVRVKSLIYATLMTLVMSAGIYVPFLYQYQQTDITTTIQQPIIFMAGLGTNILRSIDDQYQNIGLMGVLSVVIVLVYVFQQKWSKTLAVGFMGVTLFVIGSSAFPWHMLSSELQALIQFPYRLFGLATLFLAVFLSKAMLELISDKKARKWLIVAVTAFMVVSGLGKVQEFISTRSNQKELVPNNGTKSQGLENTFVSRQVGLDTLVSSRHDYIGMIDYAPVNTWKGNRRDSVLDHQVLINGEATDARRTYHVMSATFKVNVLTKSTVDVPIFMYGNEKVKVDGQIVSYSRTKRGTVGVTLEAGVHRINVSYITPKWIYFVWLFSMMGWLALVIGYGIWLVKFN